MGVTFVRGCEVTPCVATATHVCVTSLMHYCDGHASPSGCCMRRRPSKEDRIKAQEIQKEREALWA